MKPILKKLVPLLIGLIVCSVLGGFYWFKIKPESQNQASNTTLSDRAQEFVAKDSSKGTGIWSEFDVTTATDSTQLPSESTVATACFQLYLPFKTTNHTTENLSNKCVFRAKIVSPVGYLVISSYQIPEPESDTGIVLRRSKPDLYTEQTLSHQKWDQVVRFTSDDGVLFFAWKKDRLLTIAFNAIAKPQDFPNSVVEKVLDTYVQIPATQSAIVKNTQP